MLVLEIVTDRQAGLLVAMLGVAFDAVASHRNPTTASDAGAGLLANRARDLRVNGGQSVMP